MSDENTPSEPEEEGSAEPGVSPQPSHGVRFELLRPEPFDATGEIVYRGHAHMNGVSYALEARVTADAVRTTIARDTGLPRETAEQLEKSASALVRAATRAPLAEGRPTPRKIVRWRS